VISAVKTILTKKGNKPMAILTLEDQQAQADAVIFPKAYETLKSKLQEGEVFLVYAQVSERDDKLNLIVEELFDSSQFNDSKNKQLAINISNLRDSKKIQKIKQAIHINKGGDYILKITYGNPTSPKTIKTTVKANPELINTLNEYIVK
jgi:DNA polymerase III alpha subunit